MQLLSHLTDTYEMDLVLVCFADSLTSKFTVFHTVDQC